MQAVAGVGDGRFLAILPDVDHIAHVGQSLAVGRDRDVVRVRAEVEPLLVAPVRVHRRPDSAQVIVLVGERLDEDGRAVIRRGGAVQLWQSGHFLLIAVRPVHQEALAGRIEQAEVLLAVVGHPLFDEHELGRRAADHHLQAQAARGVVDQQRLLEIG